MKKAKKIFCILIVTNFLPFQVLAATDGSNCESQNWYARYTCRVKQICDKYDSKKPVWRWDGYEDAESYRWQTSWIQAAALTQVKQIYRTNMGNIYKCALLNSQKTSLKSFKDNLVKLDKTGTLEDKIGKNIDTQLQKVDTTSSSIGCQNMENKQIYNKLNILQESTLEMCKYVTYLEYLKEYYKEIPNVVGNGGENENVNYQVQDVSQYIWGIQWQIDSEINHSLEVMPMALHAYEQYENNLPAHLLFQVIKEDFVIIRDKLQKVLNPISQVVYKISNAMQD